MVDWQGALDPAEKLDFIADFTAATLGANEAPVLAPGELIASYSLAVTAEAAALGLTIEEGAPYGPGLVALDANLEEVAGATAIKLWLSVAPAFQSNPAFESGVKLGVVATIITDSVPQRTRERTYNVEVKQQ